MLSTERAVEAINTHGQGLADAAEGNFEAAVAGCPGWSVSDLVWHVRGVHYFWAAIVEGLVTDPNTVPEIARPELETELLADYRQGVDRLASVLSSADQTASLWTWSHQQDVAFVTRHQVQEAAVHRWDAETAAGRAFNIEPDLAADSVDEFLEHSTPSRYDAAQPLRGTLHLHATDARGEWFVTEDDDRQLRVERGHQRGDAALRATASDLLLMLYRRIGTDHGEIVGDSGVVERFLVRTDLN
jgi:uncharacterized protein (TIGR03083 family)